MTTIVPAPISTASALALAACPRVDATLSLDFQHEPASGHTVLAASTQQPPLRMVRAFTRDDGSALAHLHNVSGGLLGGDRLRLLATVGRGASAQITTTGATRIYRPRANAAPCAQENHVNIAEEAVLEYVPDAIIPYAGVRFSQTSEIHLAEGAGLFWWEVLAPGREARGELFEYERVGMKTEIFTAGRLIAAERVRLEPESRPLDSLARLGEFRYWVTFYICRVGIESSLWLALEEQLRDVARSCARPTEVRWGISALPAHGLAIRGIARHGHGLLAALQVLWRAAKVALYDREPILPRKVH